MNRRIDISLRVSLTLIFVALAVWFFWEEKDEFSTLEWPSTIAVAMMSVAILLNVFLRSVYNFVTARRFAAPVTLMESFMLSVVTTAGNQLLPGSFGSGLRALYMKRVHKFPISYMASGTLVFLVVNVLLVSLVAIMLLFLIQWRLGYGRVDLLLLFPAAVLFIVLALFLARSRDETVIEDRQSWYRSFINSLVVVVTERRLLLTATAIVGLGFVVSSIAWTAVLRDYAPNTAVVEAFLLSASQIVSGFVTLTPGSAGFQELSGLYVGRSFSVSVVELLAVLIWVRILRVGIAVAVAIPCLGLLGRRMLVPPNGEARQRVAKGPAAQNR